MTILLCVAVCGTGCGRALANAREAAARLEREVLQYQNEQQAKIDKLNQQYRAAYVALVAELKAVETEQRDLLFAEDAQRIADRLIADWPNAVQPTQLHDALAAALSAQLRRVQASDDELAATKAAYAAGFEALSLQLKKLEEARKSLRAVAVRDSLEENLQLLMVIVQTAGKEIPKPKP